MKRDRDRETNLSKSLKAIITALEHELAGITGQNRTPILLLVNYAGNVQYISNVQRADGVMMLTELLERWQAQLPNVPEHLKKFAG